jgi:hypothetical protein
LAKAFKVQRFRVQGSKVLGSGFKGSGPFNFGFGILDFGFYKISQNPGPFCPE